MSEPMPALRDSGATVISMMWSPSEQRSKYKRPTGAVVDADHLMRRVGMGCPVTLSLTSELHFEERVLLGIAPRHSREFFLASAGIKIEQKGPVGVNNGSEGNRHRRDYLRNRLMMAWYFMPSSSGPKGAMKSSMLPSTGCSSFTVV